MIDLPQNQLDKCIAYFAVLDGKLAPKSRDYGRLCAFGCDEDVIVEGLCCIMP